MVVARGLDGCLDAYPREQWASQVEGRIGALDNLNREPRQLRRYVFAGAADGELDRQGRLVIPPALLGHARLERVRSWWRASTTTSRFGD